MINRLQKKYALSVQGAKDLFKAIVYSVLANISLMLPVALLAIVLNTMLPMALRMEEKVAGICRIYSCWNYHFSDYFCPSLSAVYKSLYWYL